MNLVTIAASYQRPMHRALVAVLFLLAQDAAGLNPAKSVFQYNCRSWARQNGLPGNGVYDIIQTADGYLWLGTPRGLVRFDGDEFKLFDVSRDPQALSTVVTCLEPARGGGFWFGMERGSFGFCDGRNISLLGKTEWGGKSLYVQSLLQTREGDLWIASERMGARLRRDHVFESLLTNVMGSDKRYDVTALCQDSRGRLWLGTSQQGLFRWQDGVLTRIDLPLLDDLTIHCLAEDRTGYLWLGTQNGLLRYEPDFKKQSLPFPWFETRALLVDREGTVWAGTTGAGLVRFVNGVPTGLRKIDGLADDFVSALAEDEEGSVWVGTRNGLSQLSDVKIPTLGKTEGLNADVYVGVYPSRKGGFWIATGEGFIYYDGTPHPYTASIGLKNPYTKTVFEASNGDLYLINGVRDVEIFSGGRIVASYANKAWPTSFAEDAQGVIVALGTELYRVGTNYLRPYEFAGGRKPLLRWVFSMASSGDGSVWVGSHGGICRLRGDTFELWASGKELPDGKVLAVCEDDEGVLWAGLESGLVRLKHGKVQVITQNDGLFDNRVIAIVPDNCGSLWVDSSRGFFRASRKSLNDFADGKTGRVACVGFDGLDAIKSSEKYHQEPSGCKTRDGRIWFPTAQGIVMIDPTNITVNPVPPRVNIHQVLANGREIDGQNAVVPPGKGDLEFHYSGLSFIAPIKINYRYKLEGNDLDWIEAGTRRAAFYTNLKPGNYRFRVQACNEDGVWSQAVTSFEVVLQPHFYQTLWFYALCALSVVGVLIGMYRWRVRHLQRKQCALQQASQLLEARVAERTAELARSNTSLVQEVQQRIQTQAELEGRKAALEKEIEERKRMQEEVERVHRQLIDASRQAGKAEVASSVLHNVGNVLNSVNISTGVVCDRLRNLQISNLTRAVQLVEDNTADLGRFFTLDEKGRKLPLYLGKLARHMSREQGALLAELKQLTQNVEHIKEIVAMQQTYATVSGVTEKVALSDLVETALKMHAGSYRRRAVTVVRQFEEVPTILVDRHKALQILINVLKNAKCACEESQRPDKQVTVRIRRQGADRVQVAISDNGVGIAPENLTRIFSHGFTTRKNGHGFGLHSAALAAKEMQGELSVDSAGLDQGATFTLELPLAPATPR